MPHPYVIAMSPDARRRRAQSTIEVPALRFDPGTDSNGETDAWFVSDRTADVQTVLQNEWNRSTPFERARNRIVPWLIGLIAATCIAGLTFLVLRRELRPSPAAPPPSPPVSAPVPSVPPPTPTASAPVSVPPQAVQVPPAPQPPVVLAAVTDTPAPAVVDAPPPDAPKHRARPQGLRRKADAGTGHRKESARRRVATAGKIGTGTLMVSSKPPCDIVIDGVATVLTTPQRAIKVRAGKHTLTLYNLRLGVEVTVPFVVEAHKTTKVIRDLMRH